MKMALSWKGRMQFVATAGGLSVELDAKPPVGGGSALTPKELLVAALCGCTAMDVVGLLRKNRQKLEHLVVEAELQTSEGGHPVVFTSARLRYLIEGELDARLALEAVELSQTRYCAVSAMLSKAFPISYQVTVNGTEVGQGVANFG